MDSPTVEQLVSSYDIEREVAEILFDLFGEEVIALLEEEEIQV